MNEAFCRTVPVLHAAVATLPLAWSFTLGIICLQEGPLPPCQMPHDRRSRRFKGDAALAAQRPRAAPEICLHDIPSSFTRCNPSNP
jgi:hypothetical protein